MKNKLLLSLLLGFGSLNVWAEPEPAPPTSKDSEPANNAKTGDDPFAQSNQAPSLPKMIQVQVEFIELPHKALTKLLFLADPKTSDGTALRKKLQEMVEKDEAEVLETQVVVGKNGQKATNESIHEFIYPTEYQPPGLPENNSGSAPDASPKTSIAPGEVALPTAFGTRNLGSTLEVEGKLSHDNKFVELRFVPELVWHTGNTEWLESKDALGNVSKVQMPDFYTIRTNTSVTCVPGQYQMVSVLSPKDSKGELDQTRKVMVFVKCDIVTAK
jgi:hypothetical protein